MSDRETVIKGLEETETMLIQAVDRGGEMAVMGAFKCLNCVTNALALLKEQEPDNGWISVKDNTPNINSECLIVFDPPKTCTQVMQVYVDNGRNYWRGNVQLNAELVTHWMPLPEPPKEGEVG